MAGAAIAARTAGSPHPLNGPTVLRSTSPRSASAKTEAGRSTSATRHSRPPSRSESSPRRVAERPARIGLSPCATRRSAVRRPVYPVAPKTVIREGIPGTVPAILRLLTTEANQDEEARCGPSRGPGKEHMAEVHEVSVEIGGAQIVFETGRLAKQASGAVLVASGDTRVLFTATAGNLRDIDFMPLTVDGEERMYAAGKIPGSFFKREGRAGESATLIARMIDRPLRPLFPKGWRSETQLVGTPVSVDHDNPYDILAMNGASAALMVSSIPFPTPLGAVRIGNVEGNFVVNPTEEQQTGADLDLVVAGTDEAILMVEAG